MTGCFAVGIYVGWRYKDINALPFLACGEWAIGIYTGPNPFELTPASGMEQPVLGPDEVTDGPARQQADPFMVYEQGLWYLFFEVVHARTNQGDLAFCHQRGRFELELPAENYRRTPASLLSVRFQVAGGVLHDSRVERGTRGISLQSNEIPFGMDTGWQDSEQNRGRSDLFFVYRDSCWLYLASLSRGGLMLFFANDPRGPWTEHPQSPIIRGDMNTASPAGRVTEFEGKLYRYAMDCDPDYGNAVRVFEINELNTTGYRETEIRQSPILKGSGEGWNSHRMHHCDPHKLDNGTWMASVDGWKKVVQFGLKY
jgi:hypothetical protein